MAAEERSVQFSEDIFVMSSLHTETSHNRGILLKKEGREEGIDMV